MTPLPAFVSAQFPKQIQRQIAQVGRLDPDAYRQIVANAQMGCVEAALNLLRDSLYRAADRLGSRRDVESTWLAIVRRVEKGQLPVNEFDQKQVGNGLALYRRRDGRVALYNQANARTSGPVAEFTGVNWGLISSPTARAWKLTANARANFDSFIDAPATARRATTHRAYTK